MGKRESTRNSKKVKCNTCGDTVKVDCDYRQGRCPHRPPLIDDKIIDMIKQKLYNLFRGKK